MSHEKSGHKTSPLHSVCCLLHNGPQTDIEQAVATCRPQTQTEIEQAVTRLLLAPFSHPWWQMFFFFLAI